MPAASVTDDVALRAPAPETIAQLTVFPELARRTDPRVRRCLGLHQEDSRTNRESTEGRRLQRVPALEGVPKKRYATLRKNDRVFDARRGIRRYRFHDLCHFHRLLERAATLVEE